MDKSSVSCKRDMEIKNKNKYEGLIEKCFDSYESDLVYKSFVESAPFWPEETSIKQIDQE